MWGLVDLGFVALAAGALMFLVALPLTRASERAVAAGEAALRSGAGPNVKEDRRHIADLGWVRAITLGLTATAVVGATIATIRTNSLMSAHQEALSLEGDRLRIARDLIDSLNKSLTHLEQRERITDPQVASAIKRREELIRKLTNIIDQDVNATTPISSIRRIQQPR